MSDMSWHTPDPASQPEFYEDVPIKRLIAWAIDTVIILAICVIILPFTAFTGLFFLPFLILTVGLLYRVATIAHGSATLGMRVVSIEFLTLDGRKLEPSYAALHSLGFTISCAMPVFWVASCVLMLTTMRGQGLTDLILGTVAVNRRAAM